MTKERIVIICPGRGTYTRDTSGYLAAFGASAKNQIAYMNDQRKLVGNSTLTELDSKPFRAKIHMSGEHASPLIYACSLSDFLSIDQEKYEIVAITGNSMGWYSALALSGALNHENAYSLISTMGSMMKEGTIGGQIIYSVVDENWHVDESEKEEVLTEIKNVNAHVSIYLGGYLVIGGEQSALDILLKKLPAKDNYPFQLPFHAAFHTPLLDSISKKAYELLPQSIFQKPSVSLVDGRGHIWSPYSTETVDLYNYTLGHQVTNVYDFFTAITVAIKEFCPDKLVLLGPGNTLGGSIGQIMIENNWLDMDSKSAFSSLQKENPYLISMGMEEQRKLVC
ncbi:MAG TPA: ACP S-malonyltransferase [Candidatus Marinimicrobia bacterium]|jgi:acyl transferase domain-containing protein|nr:ACP S-malonyltransferase [Candidatus Neomarinimicrobiota bacterium]